MSRPNETLCQVDDISRYEDDFGLLLDGLPLDALLRIFSAFFGALQFPDHFKLLLNKQ